MRRRLALLDLAAFCTVAVVVACGSLGCDENEDGAAAKKAEGEPAEAEGEVPPSPASSGPAWTTPATAPTDGDAKGETLTLGFAWPRTLDARVETTREQERRGRKVRIRATWRMQARRTPDGRVEITHQDFGADEKVDVGAADFTAATSALGALVPDMLISEKGEFQSVENPERSARKMRELFFALAPGVDEGKAGGSLDQVLNPEALGVKASSEWSSLVGNWRGLAVTLGKEQSSADMSPLGIGGVPEIQFDTTYRVVGKVPCVEGSKRPTCVRIEGSSVPPADQLELFANLIFSKLAGANQMPSDLGMKEVELKTTFTLLTEPDTLVPHRLRFERTMRAMVGTPQGAFPMNEIESQERLYRYRSPGPPERR